jgi:hypothetical protein
VTGFAGPFFPTLATSFASQAFYGGFICKVDHLTGQLVYSTYVPGVSFDIVEISPLKIAVDPGGHAYVAGPGGSGFVTTPGAFQMEPNSNPFSRFPSSDAFLLELDAESRNLVFSTLFGGGGNDMVFGLALTGSSVTIAGDTDSYFLPTNDYGLPVCNLISIPVGLIPHFTTFTASFDHTGKLVTAFEYGRCSEEHAAALAQGPSLLWMPLTYISARGTLLAGIDLNATAPAQVSVVADAASFQVGPYVPLEIVTIEGTSLGL